MRLSKTIVNTMAVGSCFLAVIATAAEPSVGNLKLSSPFFAFQNGLWSMPLEEQVKLLSQLGYDGIAFEGPLHETSKMLKLLNAYRLKMFCLYTRVYLSDQWGKPPYDPDLKATIQQLRGCDTMLWIPVIGERESTGANLDLRAVAILGEIADMAEAAGIRVALYPHTAFHVEKVSDALRLVKKLHRKNVGVAFNLCHFLAVEDEKHLAERLQEALPHLFVVSINGADSRGANKPDWKRLIQTLDRGNFDVRRVIGTLCQLNYTGPIGLQCFGIPGDPSDNLARSMKAWHDLSNGIRD